MVNSPSTGAVNKAQDTIRPQHQHAAQRSPRTVIADGDLACVNAPI
ncbi:hypothetical protein SynBIOSU31_02261 [Synechococcus sp. BIOS-U3-1]|nr:hypothetical protein SynBIOSU31_02261 [Synechococcus sp. BIOS-U3-1]